MSNLYEKAVAFMQAYPAPSDYGSGNNFGSNTYHGKCAQWVFRFCDFLGWKWPGEPSPPYDTAMVAAARSGWLNPDAGAAPIGAFHFWDNGGDGHVAIDAAGGGSTIAQGYGNSESPLGVGSGFDTVWGMNVKLARSGHRYIGWSTNYCGAQPWLPEEPHQPAPAPVPELAPHERLAGPAGVRGRAAASSDAPLYEFIEPGTKVACDGWEHGESVDGIDVWFRNSITGTRMWAGNLIPSNTDGVPEMVPPTIPVVLEPEPPVVEPPVVVDPPVEEPPVVDPPVVPEEPPTPVDPTDPVEPPIAEEPTVRAVPWLAVVIGVIVTAIVGFIAAVFGG